MPATAYQVIGAGSSFPLFGVRAAAFLCCLYASSPQVCWTGFRQRQSQPSARLANSLYAASVWVAAPLGPVGIAPLITRRNWFLEHQEQGLIVYGSFIEARGNSHRIFTLLKPTFSSQPTSLGSTKTAVVQAFP